MKPISKLKLWTGLLFFPMLIAPRAFSQSTAADSLGIGDSLSFDGLQYTLSWSSHPTDNFYKQEYIPQGQNIAAYQQMVLIDVNLDSKVSVKGMVQTKVRELQERKKTDAVVNYQVLNNPEKTEYMIDFVLSQQSNGRLEVVEWNAYRYRTVTTKTGVTGVMLFGISCRAYGDDIRPFLNTLRELREKKINALTEYPIPMPR